MIFYQTHHRVLSFIHNHNFSSLTFMSSYLSFIPSYLSFMLSCFLTFFSCCLRCTLSPSFHIASQELFTWKLEQVYIYNTSCSFSENMLHYVLFVFEKYFFKIFPIFGKHFNYMSVRTGMLLMDLLLPKLQPDLARGYDTDSCGRFLYKNIIFEIFQSLW